MTSRCASSRQSDDADQRRPARPAVRCIGLSVAAGARRARSIGASARSASLIEAASGKTSITSGIDRDDVRALPVSRHRRAPRCVRKLVLRAHGVTIGGECAGCFFIGPPLPRGRQPCRNEPCSRRSFGMSHYQKTLAARHPKQKVSLGVHGMHATGCPRQRIRLEGGIGPETEAWYGGVSLRTASTEGSPEPEGPDVQRCG